MLHQVSIQAAFRAPTLDLELLRVSLVHVLLRVIFYIGVTFWDFSLSLPTLSS